MPDRRLTKASDAGRATIPDDPIAVLSTSPFRRGIALAVQLALGVMMIGISLRLPEMNLVVQAPLIALGGFMIWRSHAMYRATDTQLILSRDGLFESSGRQLFAMDNVFRVERGAFAFKPTNGFLVTLKTGEPRAWVPGLWWRVGKRVGIGGVISGKAARDMADFIALMLLPEGAALIEDAIRNINQDEPEPR